MFKVKFDESKCTGCSICTNFCPENWTMVGYKARPKIHNLVKLGANKDAEENCPANAIKVVKV